MIREFDDGIDKAAVCHGAVDERDQSWPRG